MCMQLVNTLICHLMSILHFTQIWTYLEMEKYSKEKRNLKKPR